MDRRSATESRVGPDVAHEIDANRPGVSNSARLNSDRPEPAKSELNAWLRLQHCNRLTPDSALKLVRRLGDAAAVFDAAIQAKGDRFPPESVFGSSKPRMSSSSEKCS